MGNISKKAGGPIRADEVAWSPVTSNKKKDDDQDALESAIGGGVTKPVPVAFPWTIYTVSSTEDDDKPGIYCLAVFDVPKDTMGLKIKYCYVKNSGAYGRVKWFPSYRLDDDERAAGRVEIQFGPLRANSRIDLVRLVAVKRAAKDIGNPSLGEDDRRGKGTTPAYTPPTVPVSGGAWGTYTIPYANQVPGDSDPLTMGTILTGDYIIGSPRVLRVSSPKTEVDGIYYPVDIGTTGNAEEFMISARFGVYRVGTKAGGANAYSKRIVLPRYELTEEDRETLIAGSALTVDVGPFKANKRYHIKWVRARYSIDPDDTDAKVIRTRHPAAVIVAGVDETQNYDANDAVDGQGNTHTKDILDASIPVPGGGSETPPDNNPKPYLATLVPTGDIVYAPSDPASGDIIVNEPDLDTEKDKDARIVLRVWAAGSDHTKTFADANVTRVAVVIRNITADGTTKQRRHAVDIEEPTATSVNIEFHRQIGRPLQWVKNVSLNEADREPSTGSVVDFTAGATGDHTKITSFAIAITNDADDNRQADASITFTNDATTPAVPKRLVICRSLSTANTTPPTTLTEINNGCTNWKPVFKKNLRADSETLATSGPKTINLTIPGVTLAKGVRYYRAFMFVVGDATWVEAEDDNTGTVADGLTDTGAPGEPGTPTLRFRHGHLRLKTTRPTTNNNTIFQYEWTICSTTAFTANGTRTFIQDNDTTPITTSLATIISTGNKLSIPIKRKDFVDGAWNSTNICVQVKAWNLYPSGGTGTAGANCSTPLTFAIGAPPYTGLDDSTDTAAPGACTFGRAKFKHGNLRVRCIRPTTENNTIIAYHWIVSDSITPGDTSATYLQDSASGLEISAVSGNPTSDRIVTAGPVLVLPVKKATLTGMGSTIYVHVVAQNLIGTSTSAATLSITTSSLVSGVYNDDEDIPVRRTFHGRVNLIEGGGCYNSASQLQDTADDGTGGAVTDLGKNVRFAIGGTRVSTTSTASGGIWDLTTHSFKALNTGTGSRGTVTIFWRLKRQLAAGDEATLTFLSRASASPLGYSANVVCDLVNSSGNSLLTGGTAVTMSTSWPAGAASTNFRTFLVRFTMTSSPTTAGLYLKMTFVRFNSTEAIDIFHDNFCLVRGTQGMLWEPGPKEAQREPEVNVAISSTGFTSTLLGVGLGTDSVTAGAITL